MRSLKVVVVLLAVALFLIACNSASPRSAKEKIGTTSEQLIAIGQRCTVDAQCTGGTDGTPRCVDTVCCQDACGQTGGQDNDNLTCSDLYCQFAKNSADCLAIGGTWSARPPSTVELCHDCYGPGQTNGTCFTISTVGKPCGSVTAFSPCKWRGTTVNGGFNCPQAGSTLDLSCQPCTTSADCPAGLPICTNGACSACTADFNTQPAPVPDTRCPTATAPACIDSACFECSGTNTANCGVGANINKGSCDVALHVCVGCNGNLGSGGLYACKDPLKPACMASGACAECSTSGAPYPAVACTSPPQPANETVCDSVTNPASPVCVGCITSASCPANTPVCDPATKQCVQCNGHNSSNATDKCPTTTLPACIPAPNGPGVCAQCAFGAGGDSTACTGTTPVCNDGSGSRPLNTCVECNPATVAVDCANAVGKFCQNHSCVTSCVGDGDCATTPTTPFCVGGSCVACKDNNDVDVPSAECSGATPYCHSNACVECAGNKNPQPPTECPVLTKPVCNVASGSCVKCDGEKGSGAPNPCPTDLLPACDEASGECNECDAQNASRCTGTPKPFCDVTQKKCVECLTGANCTTAAPVCNPATHACVPCNADNGAAGLSCPDPQKPACATGTKQGQCVECLTTKLTACTTTKPVCNVTDPVDADVCVECNSDAQCTGLNGKCNTTTHECTIGCTTDANCPNTEPVCKLPAGICVECTTAKPQHCVTPKPFCDDPSNKCVGCVTGANCPKETPVCNPTTHTCTADCTKNEECPATAPVCNPQTKKCVECVDNTTCKEPKPICNTTTNTCGTECTKSSECPNTAPICNPQTRQCVECIDNTQCKEPKPICNTTTGVCGTECTKSSECPGTAPICNPQTKKCVQCTDNTQCKPPTPICNPATGTCGNDCTKNSDCTGATPICNPASKKCIECGSNGDCPANAPICDPGTNTCKADDAFNVEGAGCACSTVPSRTNNVPIFLGLGVAISVFAARRRSRRRHQDVRH